MPCGCWWWCNWGCGIAAKKCCKSNKLSYTELLDIVPTCTDGVGSILVYNEWEYCKVELSTLLWDWGISWDTLDITGNWTIWWDLQVDWDLNVDGDTTLEDTTIDWDLVVTGCVTADCLNVSWAVDFTGADITFDNWEICDEVSRCVMNDADVIAAIEAVANWVWWDFWCPDVASCVGSHAGTQNAIRDLMAWLATFWANNAFANALDAYISAHLADSGCCGWWGPTWGVTFCATDTWTAWSLTQTVQNWGSISSQVDRTSTISWQYAVSVTGQSASSCSYEVLVNGTVADTWTLQTTNGTNFHPLSWVVAWDTISINPLGWCTMDIFAVEAVANFELCWEILS